MLKFVGYVEGNLALCFCFAFAKAKQKHKFMPHLLQYESGIT